MRRERLLETVESWSLALVIFENIDWVNEGLQILAFLFGIYKLDSVALSFQKEHLNGAPSPRKNGARVEHYYFCHTIWVQRPCYVRARLKYFQTKVCVPEVLQVDHHDKLIHVRLHNRTNVVEHVNHKSSQLLNFLTEGIEIFQAEPNHRPTHFVPSKLFDVIHIYKSLYHVYFCQMQRLVFSELLSCYKVLKRLFSIPLAAI